MSVEHDLLWDWDLRDLFPYVICAKSEDNKLNKILYYLQYSYKGVLLLHLLVYSFIYISMDFYLFCILAYNPFLNYLIAQIIPSFNSNLSFFFFLQISSCVPVNSIYSLVSHPPKGKNPIILLAMLTICMCAKSLHSCLTL